MSQWFYSDAQRNRLGPVSAEEMAALHHSGHLGPDTLVWRSGMAEWAPWRAVQAEIVPAGPPVPTVLAAPQRDPAIARDLHAPGEPASPYAPPTAPVDASPAVVQAGEIVYAGLWKRFAAAVIDGLVMFPALFILALVMGWNDEVAPLLSLESLLLVVIPTVYLAVMQARPAGASLGKMATRIKVVRSDGTPMSLPRAFGRSALLQVLGQVVRGVIMIILGLMIPFSPRGQSLHDRLFDTVVVDRHAFTEEAHLQDPNLNGVTIAVLALFVLVFVGAFLAAALGLGSLMGA